MSRFATSAESTPIASASRFPAFEAWKRLSEKEQDALLDRMARAQRRRAMLLRCLFAAAGTILAAGIASGLYAALIVWR
jgi:hypothetical protein